MMSSECPECGTAVSLLSDACTRCGEHNPWRGRAIAAAAAAVVLIVAAVLAIEMAPSPSRPVVAAGTPVGPSSATAEGDFAWLESAMKACDQEASAQPDNLHFLVIPLVAAKKDMPDWQILAKGLIGNAVTIRAEDALRGLKRGTLKMYADKYVFGIQDAATSTVARFNPSVGAASFSTTKVDAIRSFRLQLQPVDKAANDNWGNVFTVQKGNCDWVAAIVAD
jgi:hypothetical protein